MLLNDIVLFEVLSCCLYVAIRGKHCLDFLAPMYRALFSAPNPDRAGVHPISQVEGDSEPNETLIRPASENKPRTSEEQMIREARHSVHTCSPAHEPFTLGAVSVFQPCF